MTAPNPYDDAANSVMVQLTRLSCGWSKKRLADEAAVSASHVSRVEAGLLPLAGKALLDYAQAMGCRPEALCVPFTRSPAQGSHFRANLSAAEWKRDRVWARANLVAMRIGRLVSHADINPKLALPDLDPADFASELGEITVAQVLRRLWRIAGPIRSMTELLEAAGVFVVVDDFLDDEIDAVTLRASEHHPHLVYVNAARPPDRMRMTLAHELGHLVMDAMTLVSPAEVERRANSFAAEFLAPIGDIGFDLDRVSVRTVHELDELRLTWGVSASSLVVRAHERGVLSGYQYRSMFRLLNETGRMYGPRPGVAEEVPQLVGTVLDQLTAAGYTSNELDDITLLTSAQRGALFGSASNGPRARHLSMVQLSGAIVGWNRTPVRDEQWRAPVHWTKQGQALEQDRAAGGRHHRVVRDSARALGRVVLQRRNRRLYAELRWQTNNKQYSQYLCEVSAKNRTANLAAGWRHAHSNGLTESPPPARDAI